MEVKWKHIGWRKGRLSRQRNSLYKDSELPKDKLKCTQVTGQEEKPSVSSTSICLVSWISPLLPSHVEGRVLKGLAIGPTYFGLLKKGSVCPICNTEFLWKVFDGWETNRFERDGQQIWIRRSDSVLWRLWPWVSQLSHLSSFYTYN